MAGCNCCQGRVLRRLGRSPPRGRARASARRRSRGRQRLLRSCTCQATWSRPRRARAAGVQVERAAPSETMLTKVIDQCDRGEQDLKPGERLRRWLDARGRACRPRAPKRVPMANEASSAGEDARDGGRRRVSVGGPITDDALARPRRRRPRGPPTAGARSERGLDARRRGARRPCTRRIPIANAAGDEPGSRPTRRPCGAARGAGAPSAPCRGRAEPVSSARPRNQCIREGVRATARRAAVAPDRPRGPRDGIRRTQRLRRRTEALAARRAARIVHCEGGAGAAAAARVANGGRSPHAGINAKNSFFNSSARPAQARGSGATTGSIETEWRVCDRPRRDLHAREAPRRPLASRATTLAHGRSSPSSGRRPPERRGPPRQRRSPFHIAHDATG